MDIWQVAVDRPAAQFVVFGDIGGLMSVLYVALESMYCYPHPGLRGEAGFSGHGRRDNRIIAFHGMSPYYS